MNYLESLTLRDISIIADIPRYSSLRNLALAKNTGAANISKIIQHIEQSLNIKIIERSYRGIVLTKEGETLSLIAREMLNIAEKLTGPTQVNTDLHMDKGFTIGTRGFINNSIIGPILNSLQDHKLNPACRFIDLSPNDLIEAATKSAIDVAISIDKIKLGERWVGHKVGELEWKVYARYNHPIGVRPELATLSHYHFTRATFWDGKSVVQGEDFIPLEKKLKYFGHGSQTTISSIEIIKATDHMTYLPTISAKDAVLKNEIREIRLPEMNSYRHSVWLYVDRDKIKQNTLRMLRDTLSVVFN